MSLEKKPTTVDETRKQLLRVLNNQQTDTLLGAMEIVCFVIP